MNPQQLEKVRSGSGFIAALDQSGGSTPKALKLYGIPEDAYSGEDEMFALVQEMRARIVTSPSFGGDRIVAAILFEGTLDREIEGLDSATYLWTMKNVVPFLKIDKGLTEESDGVQLMKPIPDLDELLKKALAKGVLGTKMRSVILLADKVGVQRIVDQQFELAHQILAAGLIPIIEPEIDIHSPQKSEAEDLLWSAIEGHLEQVPSTDQVMLKLTLPNAADFYADFVRHPQVARVVALSGGYSRDDANELLVKNHGVIASFSRSHRRPDRPAKRSRVRCHARRGDRQHLPGVDREGRLALRRGSPWRGLRPGSTAPLTSKRLESRLDVVGVAVRPSHPEKELTRPRHVSHAFVEIRQGVPLSNVPLSRVSERLGGPSARK